MNDVISLLKNHRSIRKFEAREVSEDIVSNLIQAAQSASTSSFMQAYSIIRVNDKNKRKEIAILSGDQRYVEEAPLFFVFCGDLNHINRAVEFHTQEVNMGFTETFMIATVDASLAAQNLFIAAESLGLGGVYIGGIRNNPCKMVELLNIPTNAFPLFGICIGYPAQSPDIKPRLPKEVIYMVDEYRNETDQQPLKSYDETVKEYYVKRTKGKLETTWSKQMAERMNGELRPHMRDFLRKQGFEMK